MRLKISFLLMILSASYSFLDASRIRYRLRQNDELEHYFCDNMHPDFRHAMRHLTQWVKFLNVSVKSPHENRNEQQLVVHHDESLWKNSHAIPQGQALLDPHFIFFKIRRIPRKEISEQLRRITLRAIKWIDVLRKSYDHHVVDFYSEDYHVVDDSRRWDRLNKMGRHAHFLQHVSLTPVAVLSEQLYRENYSDTCIKQALAMILHGIDRLYRPL